MPSHCVVHDLHAAPADAPSRTMPNATELGTSLTRRVPGAFVARTRGREEFGLRPLHAPHCRRQRNSSTVLLVLRALDRLRGFDDPAALRCTSCDLCLELEFVDLAVGLSPFLFTRRQQQHRIRHQWPAPMTAIRSSERLHEIFGFGHPRWLRHQNAQEHVSICGIYLVFSASL